MNKNLILIISMALAFASSDALAKKKLYKWVDDNGNVSYSDQVPPSQIEKQHEELNDQGVVLGKVASAQTVEEREAAKAERLRQMAVEKKAAEKRKAQQNILKAYTNEKEITRLKEERLAGLARNIELANQSLVFQKTSKEQLLSLAADKERSGAGVSKALKSRIRTIDEKIENQIEFIEVKKAEIKRVTEKFIHDMKLYQEAKQANS